MAYGNIGLIKIESLTREVKAEDWVLEEDNEEEENEAICL